MGDFIKNPITITLTVMVIAVILGIVVFVVGIKTNGYVPYTDVVYCDGEQVASVTADTHLSAAHPRVDGDWVVWYEGSARLQIRISHCQSIVIVQIPIT